MMRSGRLLAEDSPQNLLAIHNMTSLEDVFLKLCMKNNVDDDYSEPLSSSTLMTVSDNSNFSHPSLANTRKRQSNKSSYNKSPKRVFKPSLPSPHRIMTLTHKNFIQTFRNFGSVIKNDKISKFIIIIFFIIIIIFFLTFGTDIISFYFPI